MPVWFYAPEFRCDLLPSNLFIVRAYIATFHSTNYGESLQLCMLHDDWHGTFPIHYRVLEALAEDFAISHGLEMTGSPSYGYVQRGVQWKRAISVVILIGWDGFASFVERNDDVRGAISLRQQFEDVMQVKEMASNSPNREEDCYVRGGCHLGFTDCLHGES